MELHIRLYNFKGKVTETHCLILTLNVPGVGLAKARSLELNWVAGTQEFEPSAIASQGTHQQEARLEVEELRLKPDTP